MNIFLFEPFKSSLDVDLSVGGFVIEKTNEMEVHVPKQKEIYSRDEFNQKEIFWKLVHGDYAFLDSPINKIYKKSVMARFDETICISEDKAFNIECLKNVKKLALVSSAGYHYIMNDVSLSHRKYENLHLDLQKVDDLLFDYVRKFLKDECLNELNYTISETFLRCVRHYISQNMDNKMLTEKIVEMVGNNNFQIILTLDSNSLQGKIVKSLMKKKKYRTFIKFYKFYIKVKGIDTNKN